MTKYFCDKCGVELDDRNDGREPLNSLISFRQHGRTLLDRNINISITVQSAAPRPDLCKYCVLDSIAELDDRPKPALRP